MKVVLLAGGVGGAKLAEGLAAHIGAGLSVIVNTGDDLERHGLAIWPDIDTVAYTLGDLDDAERGWGLRDESWTVMDRLESLGASTWFRLGDRDLATHLWRTDRLRAGERPTEVARALGLALGIQAAILPMADEPVRTEVLTDDGWLEFQEYFVHLHQAPTVHDVRFRGIEAARATPEVQAALESADAIVIAPSNPVVSIGPILALDGIRAGLERAGDRGVPRIAVSGIIGGKALKGPADRMLESLGETSSAAGVAARYRGAIDGFVMDDIDRALGPEIEALGVRALVTDTIMSDDAGRSRLAADVLRFAAELRAGS